MAKIKTYIASGVIWPEAAEALGIPSHVIQVNVYLAAPTKKAAEDYLLSLGLYGSTTWGIVKIARVNDSARAIRALKAAGHLDELSAYVGHMDRGNEKVAQVIFNGFEPIDLQR